MKNNKSVTAVEFLEQHLFLDDNWRRIFEQAKEMEKKQIIEAFKRGIINEMNGIEELNSEQYYLKTYKQD